MTIFYFRICKAIGQLPKCQLRRDLAHYGHVEVPDADGDPDASEDGYELSETIYGAAGILDKADEVIGGRVIYVADA